MPNFIAKIENFPITAAQWIAVFVGICALRLLMNSYDLSVSEGNYLSRPSLLFLALTVYLSIAAGAAVVVKLYTRAPLRAIANLTLWALLALVIIMPLDAIFTAGQGVAQHLDFSPPSEWLSSYCTFFGPTSSGISIGMRAALGVILSGLAFYVWQKTRNTGKTIGAIVTIYTVFFLTNLLPGIIGSIISLSEGLAPSALSATHNLIIFARPEALLPGDPKSILDITNILLALYYLILAAALLLLWWTMENRAQVKAFFTQIRYSRLTAHFILVGGGMYLAYISNGRPALAAGGLPLVAIFIYTGLNWLYALIENDIHDQGIDRASPPNRNRILPRGLITTSAYRQLQVIIVALSTLIVLTLGYRFVLLHLILLLLPHLYSSPPFRLRRFPIVTNITIAFQAIALVTLGAYAITPELYLPNFPRVLLWLVLIGTILVSPLKDLKDREADRAHGIITIPTLLGDWRARQLIAALVFLACILATLAAPSLPLLAFAAFFGALTALAILAPWSVKTRELSASALLAIYLLVVIWFYTN